jgi:hypothetical protein
MVIAGVIVAVLVVAAALWSMFSQSSDHERSGGGCVNVSYASSMGGSVERACGQAARDWCQTVSALHDAHAEAIAAQCRIAGILR